MYICIYVSLSGDVLPPRTCIRMGPIKVYYLGFLSSPAYLPTCLPDYLRRDQTPTRQGAVGTGSAIAAHSSTAAHCSTLQHTAKYSSTLQHTASHDSTPHHTAAHSSILQPDLSDHFLLGSGLHDSTRSRVCP